MRLSRLGRDEEHWVGPCAAGTLPHFQLLRVGGALRLTRHDVFTKHKKIIDFNLVCFPDHRVVNPKSNVFVCATKSMQHEIDQPHLH